VRPDGAMDQSRAATSIWRALSSIAGHRWAILIERQFVVALDRVAAFSVMSNLLNGKDGFRPLAGSDVRWLVDQHPHVGRTWRALLSMVRKRSGLAWIRDVVP